MDEKNVQKILVEILYAAVNKQANSPAVAEKLTPDILLSVYRLAKKHDLGHIIAEFVYQNKIAVDGELKTALQKAALGAVYRYERLQYAFTQLCRALEEEKIPFLPLKGSVIRQYYSEPWMRTSCDIDVLVREEDVERAKDILVTECGYTYRGKGAHDISLYTSNQIHVELHYDLIEDRVSRDSAKILQRVWSTTKIREGFCFWHEMPDEMFYFYHIAHMAKHFADGGCGVRPLMDLWILDAIPGADWNKRNELLAKGKLLKFAEAARKLSRIWFGNEEYDNLASRMEAYILRGGVYGSYENQILVHQQKKGGRLRYALSKIFIPYDVIKFHYPILRKYRWLMPLMQVRRWCKLIFCGHLKRTTKELRYNSQIGDAEAADTRKFLHDLGL